MHHLRLIRGASYWGTVKADKAHPDVYVEDGPAYESAMASGYFKEIHNKSAEEEWMNNPPQIEDYVEDSDGDTYTHATQLSEMTVEELKAYAGINGIPLGSVRKKEAILKAILDAEEKATKSREALRSE